VLPLVHPLFVPGDRPERVEKAFQSGTDAVIIDFEDAVAPARKAEARAMSVELLGRVSPDCGVLVRVNGFATPDLLAADLEALRPRWGAVDAVVLPKAESAEQIRHLDGLLAAAGATTTVVPILESARAIEDAGAIAAASPRVAALLFGSADLSAELGVVPTAEGLELLMARSRLVLASAAAGIAKPIDGPWLVLDDPDGLAASARQARRLGFGGKAAIHPEQLPAIRAAFAPTADEVDLARRVLDAFEESEASGVGAVKLADGTFIDAPVADRARSILRSSEGM